MKRGVGDDNSSYFTKGCLYSNQIGNSNFKNFFSNTRAINHMRAQSLTLYNI